MQRARIEPITVKGRHLDSLGRVHRFRPLGVRKAPPNQREDLQVLVGPIGKKPPPKEVAAIVKIDIGDAVEVPPASLAPFHRPEQSWAIWHLGLVHLAGLLKGLHEIHQQSFWAILLLLLRRRVNHQRIRVRPSGVLACKKEDESATWW